eukprot:432404-Rhodomonas_salina.1
MGPVRLLCDARLCATGVYAWYAMPGTDIASGRAARDLHADLQGRHQAAGKLRYLPTRLLCNARHAHTVCCPWLSPALPCPVRTSPRYLPTRILRALRYWS